MSLLVVIVFNDIVDVVDGVTGGIWLGEAWRSSHVDVVNMVVVVDVITGVVVVVVIGVILVDVVHNYLSQFKKSNIQELFYLTDITIK